MRPFVLEKRRNSTNLYVRFYNPSLKKYMTRRSTGTSDQFEALQLAFKWLENDKRPETKKPKKTASIPSISKENFFYNLYNADITMEDAKKIITFLESKSFISNVIYKDSNSDITVKEFLTNFWDYDKSPYIKQKKERGHAIHKRHIISTNAYIQKHWKALFGDRPIGSIVRKDLDTLLAKLTEENLAGQTKNKIIRAGTIAFRWAFAEGLIDHDCSIGFTYCALNTKKRQILTTEQVQKIMSLEWKDDSAKLASKIAMTTGMRCGEILALTEKSIGKDKIYVEKNWAREDGLKVPKNGETREVKLLPEIRKELLRLAEENPYTEGPRFIFYSSVDYKPVEPRYWIVSLRDACKRAGIENYKEIDFHSWRHYFTTLMRQSISPEVLRKATGHKSDKMLNLYSDHTLESDFEHISIAVEQVFGEIVGKE